MTTKVKRPLEVIASEMQIAMSRESANIIAIGNLLIEAKAQVQHGHWLRWLGDNFGSSVSTAENYVAAAGFAEKFPTVANLRLRPSALYLLAQTLDEPSILYTDEAIETIFKEAETRWVSAGKAREIAHRLYEERAAETIAAETADQSEAERAEQAEQDLQAEADAILGGPPPELPPTEEASAPDASLPPFDAAIRTLGYLQTKSLAKFAGTEHGAGAIRSIAEFLHSVADAVEKEQQREAVA
jgi:hypothetical protein